MNPDNVDERFVFDLFLADQLMDTLLDQAEKDCSEHELAPVAIWIIDASYTPLCMKTMPGTVPTCVDVALAKAITAVKNRINTVTFEHVCLGGDEWSSEPPLMSTEPDTRWSASDLANARLDPMFCSWAGGTVIYGPDGKTVIGGVGVSGRPQLKDHELALTRPWDWGQE